MMGVHNDSACAEAGCVESVPVRLNLPNVSFGTESVKPCIGLY